MPGAPSDTRAGRRREDLLGAVDTLASHLHTSFSALSTALARRSAAGRGRADTARAHLAFVLGPSVGAPRARVMFVVDGLEVRLWGQRFDGLGMSRNTPHAGSGENFDEEDEADAQEDSDSEEDSEEEVGDADAGGAVSDDASDASDGESDASETSSEPPSSRSPSPSPPSSKGSSSPASPASKPPPIIPLPGPPSRPTLQQTYTEEQAALRAAERLLSRTLASACAEEGGGMSCELAPTQTHVLLRAPRRFAHPAWLPRQNMTRALEGVLQAFMEDAGATRAPPKEKGRARARGVRTEGVWIGCAGPEAGELEWTSGGDDEEDEEDEMIWWVWDGKIAGFSDW